ncbi:ABC transporter permease [Paenibacillus vini]|uniref:ABC transporter permease n=1 Tax=Paenibacillus vini TaxID=1476024 RepID=UPI0025B6DD1F|nr:ABC transporter permease [Paenibacillus vini]MDN4069664.1 ABC transporter permease [Paenibacillus vini]
MLISLIMVLIAWLVLFVSGLAKGLSSDNASSIQNMNADYLVLDQNSDHRLSRSALTGDALEQVRLAMGADAAANSSDRDASDTAMAEPLGVQMSAVTQAGSLKKIDATFFAVEADGMLAPKVTEGQMIGADAAEEVVADSSFKAEGLKLGDVIEDQTSGRQFTIVGFSEGQSFSHSPVLHVNFAAWETMQTSGPRAMGGSGAVGEVSADGGTGEVSAAGEVSANEGVSAAADSSADGGATAAGEVSATGEVNGAGEGGAGVVFNAIAFKGSGSTAAEVGAQVSGVEVISKAEALKGIPGYKEEQGSLLMMIAFLFIIAAFVLAVFFYVITIQKINQFGVLKAIGAKTGFLARSLLAQVLSLSVFSLAIGIALTYGVSAVLPDSMPFELNFSLVGGSALLFLVVAVAGSLLSLYRVAKVDAIEAIGRAA